MLHYATSTLNQNVELHVYRDKWERDYDATNKTCGTCATVSAKDAKACKPWSLVLHGVRLGELASLPSWIQALIDRPTTWFGDGDSLHFLLA